MVRRRLGALLGLVLAVALAGCDWPQLLGGPAHTGFNSLESAITTGNVATLVPRFTATTGGLIQSSEPAVAGGTAFVVAGDGDLYAFSASGTTSCSGSPVACSPLWTAYAGGPPVGTMSPTVANGVIYVTGADGVLRAFDAAGKMNCSGSPTVCTPLWTTSVSVNFAPVFDNGTLYVDTPSVGMAAFDPAGQTNCTGTPKVCAPLWETYFSGFVSVVNGIAYVANSGLQINAYDATGTTNCSGTPKVCSQLWQYTPDYPLTNQEPDYPVIGGNRLYIQAATPFRQLPAHQNVEVFDALGSTNCSLEVTMKVCTPLWTTTDTTGAFAPAAVANSSMYVGGENGLDAYDASGVTGCAGSPTACAPLWTSALTEAAEQPLAVANGLLFGTDGTHVFALDAAGHNNCSGGVCAALWSATPGATVYSGPVVANGLVYVSVGNKLVAYGLPA